VEGKKLDSVNYYKKIIYACISLQVMWKQSSRLPRVLRSLVGIISTGSQNRVTWRSHWHLQG